MNLNLRYWIGLTQMSLKLEVVDEVEKEPIVLESMGFKPLIVIVKLTSIELKIYKEVSNDKSETF